MPEEFPLSMVDAQGRRWDRYSVDFQSDDGNFTVPIYALNYDHARMQLMALRRTATLRGQLIDKGRVDVPL